MHQLVLPFAVMAATIFVLVGLLVVFRKFLKLRQELAPEVVNAKPTLTGAAKRDATPVAMEHAHAVTQAGRPGLAA